MFMITENGEKKEQKSVHSSLYRACTKRVSFLEAVSSEQVPGWRNAYQTRRLQ